MLSTKGFQRIPSNLGLQFGGEFIKFFAIIIIIIAKRVNEPCHVRNMKPFCLFTGIFQSFLSLSRPMLFAIEIIVQLNGKRPVLVDHFVKFAHQSSCFHQNMSLQYGSFVGLAQSHAGPIMGMTILK